MFDLFTRIGPFDLLFVLSAVAFNLLIASIFLASKKNNLQLVRRIGILMLLLALPLAIVFIAYLVEGRPLRIMIYFLGILLYMLVEWLLDFVFKYDFRSKAITHVPYILLEYVALFSLIGISFDIDRTWGYIVSVSFWILMGCLIYLYASKGKHKSQAIKID